MDRRESGFVTIAFIIIIAGIIVIPTLLQIPGIHTSTHNITVSWESLQSSEYIFSVEIWLYNSEIEALEKVNSTAGVQFSIEQEQYPTNFVFDDLSSQFDFTWARIRVRKQLNDEEAEYPIKNEQSTICMLEIGIEKTFSMVGLDFTILFERT